MGNNYVGIECKEIRGHLTIMFLDDQIPPVTVFNCLNPLKFEQSIERGKFAMFGENNDIPVVTIELNEDHPLHTVRKSLLDSGLQDKGWETWNPHISLPEGVDINLPLLLKISRPYISIDGTRYYA